MSKKLYLALICVLPLLSTNVTAGTGQLTWTDGSDSIKVNKPTVYANDEDELLIATDIFDNNQYDFRNNPLTVSASSAVVVDANTNKVLFGKSEHVVRSMASITKLMTAMVTIDSRLDMHERVTLMPDDFVGAKKAGSTLKIGDTFNRAELLLLALMKSENPAAKALARSHPYGYEYFMQLMNKKAKSIGMSSAFFGDPTGLDKRNVSSAIDLVTMVKEANKYEVIRTFSASPEHRFNLPDRVLIAKNTNAIVREGAVDVGLSKTGYISEAGRCVVMQAKINNKPSYIVLMGANTSQGRTGDAKRIFAWLSSNL